MFVLVASHLEIGHRESDILKLGNSSRLSQ
jgi:hypothetical protein